MFTKKFHHFKRDKKGICCEILFPVLFLMLPIYFNKIAAGAWIPTVKVDENMYPKP